MHLSSTTTHRTCPRLELFPPWLHHHQALRHNCTSVRTDRFATVRMTSAVRTRRQRANVTYLHQCIDAFLTAAYAADPTTTAVRSSQFPLANGTLTRFSKRLHLRRNEKLKLRQRRTPLQTAVATIPRDRLRRCSEMDPKTQQQLLRPTRT